MLCQVWMSKQAVRGCKARYVWNKSQFDEVTADNTNCLLGESVLVTTES